VVLCGCWPGSDNGVLGEVCVEAESTVAMANVWRHVMASSPIRIHSCTKVDVNISGIIPARHYSSAAVSQLRGLHHTI